MTSRGAVVVLAIFVLLSFGTLLLIGRDGGEPVGVESTMQDASDGTTTSRPLAGLGASTPAAEPVTLDPVDLQVPDLAASSAEDAGRSASGSVRGRLVDASGRPVVGEPVDLLASQDAWTVPRHRDAIHDVVDRAVSDHEGRFDLGARAGAVHTLLAGGKLRPRRRVTPVAAGADLEIELPEARTLVGTVVAEDTGLPVPLARVGAHSGDDRLFTHADASGRFSIGPLLDDLVILTGFAPGYDVRISDPVAPDWGEAVLVLPPGRQLSGAVVDLETHEPVAGASVTLRVLTESRFAGEPDPLDGRHVVEDYVASTDEAGGYVLSGIPSRAFRVIVEAQGYLPSTSDRYFGRSPDFDEDLVIGLVPARDLVGVVLFEERPIEAARVELRSDEQTLSAATTDEQGRFGLPTASWDRIGPLAVQASDATGRFARRRLGAEGLGKEIVLGLVEPLVIEVQVQGGEGALAGAHVLAISQHVLPTTAVTDADGLATLVHGLAGPDVETVWLQARHAQRQSLATELTLPMGVLTGPIVLDIDDGAWFAGAVQDNFGMPIAGASVSVPGGRFASTGLDGRFTLGPIRLDESGVTTLEAQAGGHASAEWADVAPARDLVLSLAPVLRWRGRAVDAATGLALDVFKCRLQVERPGSEAVAWEDIEAHFRRAGAPGEFSVELAEQGRYRLLAVAQDHITTASVTAVFDGAREPPFAELSLARAAMLSVRVEGLAGRPVPGYQVWLVPIESAGDRETPAGVSGAGLRHQLTDEHGLARFNLGWGGELRLASGPGAWLDNGPFIVAPGDHAERRITVASLGGLDVTVLDNEAHPVGALKVDLRSVGKARVHSIRRRGRIEKALELIEVRDLPAGDYELSVSHEEYEEITLSTRVDGGRNTPAKIWLRRLEEGPSTDN